jgi:hypothetical protein
MGRPYNRSDSERLLSSIHDRFEAAVDWLPNARQGSHDRSACDYRVLQGVHRVKDAGEDRLGGPNPDGKHFAEKQ